ncbi:MAG: VWA domain-containing protein [Thiomicrorhabdus sp.]|nr:VWA domain-containing protein [Thiomicrorhabdus sp.]
MIEAFLNDALVWRAPIWLWGLWLPLVVWFMQRLLRNRQKQSYADSQLWPWVNTQSLVSQPGVKTTRPGKFMWLQKIFAKPLKFVNASRLLVFAWLCLIIALAGPRSLDTQFETQMRSGVDVMIDFDLSQSMTAEDVKPNRFLFAKSIAQSLVSELQSQDRVALNVFAFQPHSVLPLTYDKTLFDHAVNLIEPGMLPTKGSWLELALIGALNTLTQTGRGAKILVVFTDGAPPFLKPVELPKVVQSLAVTRSQKQSDTGVKVIFVGVGKTRPAPLPDAEHESGRLHVNGLLVQSRLEESQLLKLAQQTEGVYLRASAEQEFMQKLLSEIEQSAASYQDTSVKQAWVSYAQPFKVAGIISLLLAFYLWQIGSGVWRAFSKKQIILSKGTNSTVALGWLLAPLIVVSSLSFWPQNAQAQEGKANLADAYAAFAEESFELAETRYDAFANYTGWFGAGASAYKLGDLDAAVLYFRQAAWQAPNETERAKALYNLGNSYYLANLLPQAIESYQQALLYQTAYDKAQHNLQLAQKRFQFEVQAKNAKAKTSEEKLDEGATGKNDGAFYGGQKVGDSDSKEPGFGSDGDAFGGNKSGKLMKIPDIEQLTDYRLNPSIAKLRLQTVSQQSSGNKVLQAQINQQRAEQFEHELQTLQDDQKLLLIRLFEREEGFHAAQEQAHAIPGVQPW